ncbi:MULTISPECIES: rRNA pseudouridine synthase [unclassified Polaromonas]|uniref:rRNA pseudouridine synthase n=1 Tax=unclassified Polaromonas TaxID=2638319 RepID=UPI0018CB5D8B|nr:MULTISPECIES: rRNA pseudouridine synthase [unclassified Polaromonas]MBG6070950.1 23S rRNA pseudouridine2604 synthase [Polaromonas sp. CG_9.7]MBG6112740.1 23S rRNA pseudouridine2604 synthase [Polaromonas sp. CG_9.2]MDH6186215.1 23S rRNA pseudouridine2604 synthase [Polaromonas sp. CG_23.6]
MTEPVRLAKRLADMLACSRREAEQYIEGGFVTVDGVVVEEPQFRVQNQSIVLAPDASLLALTPVTILLHKPAGYESRDAAHASGDAGVKTAAQLLIVGNHAPADRSGIRPLKKHFSSSELVTPLATAASGLVVFSGDWRVARKLREDARVLEHEVVVEVSGDIKPGGLERLNRIDHGFTYQGALLPPAKVSWQSEARLRFALKGEMPGQIAYLCESVGLQVTAMKRLRVGRMPLSQLPPGQWRYLMPYERF